MRTKLLEVQPSELRFPFELKKASSCSVHLMNNSDHCVAFKVKTTSPKSYSVRPNISIIQPKLTCDITVTMEARLVAPPDLQCKDKFLIQSLVVSVGTTVEEITPSMFTKDNGRDIEEHKLKVVLISTPFSPVSRSYRVDLEQDSTYETPILKDPMSSGVKDLSTPPMYTAEDLDLKRPKDMQEVKIPKDSKELHLKIVKDVEESRSADVDEYPLAKDIKELKQRVHNLELKLTEVRTGLTTLRRERGVTTTETETLNQFGRLRRGYGMPEAQEGFSIMTVFLIAIFSIIVGYLI